MHTHMTRLRSRRAGAPKGFAMMDVLIAIVIFGIIVALAVVGYGQLRQQASGSGTKSDANALATVITSSAGAGGGSFPSETDMAAFVDTDPAAGKVHIVIAALDLDQHLSEGNVLASYDVEPVSATVPTAYFTFCIEHVANGAADSHAAYDSREGITSSSSKTGCP